MTVIASYMVKRSSHYIGNAMSRQSAIPMKNIIFIVLRLQIGFCEVQMMPKSVSTIPGCAHGTRFRRRSRPICVSFSDGLPEICRWIDGADFMRRSAAVGNCPCWWKSLGIVRHMGIPSLKKYPKRHSLKHCRSSFLYCRSVTGRSF